MLSRRMYGMKTWLVGGFVVAALLVAARPAAAISPFRPAVFEEAKAVQGFWNTLETDENGAFLPTGLKLGADGRYMLEVTDDKDHVLYMGIGRYNYEAGVLILTVEQELDKDGNFKPVVDGKAQRIEVTFGGDTLDLKVGVKKSHWVKGQLGQE